MKHSHLQIVYCKTPAMKTLNPQSLLKLYFLTGLAFLFACKSGPVNLFKASSAHEAYQRKLVNSGLDKTAMVASWISMADQSLQKALHISVPFKETGYFAAERIPASAYRFTATRGQKLNISLSKNPTDRFTIYMDVWEQREAGQPKLLASADTLGNPLQVEIKNTGTYLIRLQPELLRSGQYTLEITAGPSLSFPVKAAGRRNIQSYWGDGRDDNHRKHEGIDIFSAFHTPVIAAAEGTVVRVNENNLGGKVVWMRPKGSDYTLYYAHLDVQIATEGQQVLLGDTLGLIGNTGNARNTLPHLHFGVYGSDGAVDPFPFVNPVLSSSSKITAALNKLNATVRTLGNSILRAAPEAAANPIQNLKSGTILHVSAANSNWYTVQLPNGLNGFIQNKQVTDIGKPLSSLKVKTNQQLVYDQPDSLAAIKINLAAGKAVAVLGHFENYHLIMDDQNQTGWIKM